MQRFRSGERAFVIAGVAGAIACAWAYLVPASLDMYGRMDGLATWMMEATWDAQVGRQHGHAPAAAGGAEPPALAGESDENLAGAARAAEAGEPAGHDAAAEKRAQLALDEARQPFAAAAHAHLGEKGLEVLADHALEDAVLGMAADARVPPAAG